jgi:hypothetical protein
MLYDRDPAGFRLHVFRYATSQTYDTRRWQILEHKAAGIEQLRNYTVGVNEIEDVATEAANSADMKAAASGNPLILKETQLSTEVKKLRNLERAHHDGQFSLRSRLNASRSYAEKYGPQHMELLESLLTQRDGAASLGAYRGAPLATKEDVMAAVDEIQDRIGASLKPVTLTFRGMDFKLARSGITEDYTLTLPDGDERRLDAISRSGMVTRMNNFAEDLPRDIAVVRARIEHSRHEATSLAELVGQPFEHERDLHSAIAEHGKVQRALRKSTSLSAVKPAEARAFAAAVDVQKQKLRAMGLGQAVDEIEREEKGDGLSQEGGAAGARDGDFVGQVVKVGDGGVVQKISRSGETITHTLASLKDAHLLPAAGEVATIRYAAGVPRVVEAERTIALGR